MRSYPISLDLTHKANTLPFIYSTDNNGLGIRHFFLQPGTYDKETDAWLRR